MKTKAFFLLPVLMLCLAGEAVAQNYTADQKRQEAMIRRAYKRGRVTRNEYYKLIKEQDAIKNAIYKYNRDGVVTPREQDVIDGKLARAEDRLSRYKTNWER